MSKSINDQVYGVLSNGLKGYVPGKHISRIIKLVEKSSAEFRKFFSYTDGRQINELSGVNVDVWVDSKPDEQLVSVSYKKRVPVETSKRRKPVQCGGEKCYTIKWGDRTYRICIAWEGPCGGNVIAQ